VYKVLKDLGIAMDWQAPTVNETTWGERVAAIDFAVSPRLPQERSIIRIKPVRDLSGTEILHGNFFTSSTLKVAGMSTAMYQRFDRRVFVVRYYENELACIQELRSDKLANVLAAMPELTPELLAALRQINRVETGQQVEDSAGDDVMAMLNKGTLAFAFVIAGQGPTAFGMPEMFAPGHSLRHHGVIEKTSILMTDGRYSGVTKGACIGHAVPEAFAGGGIGALIDGDLLWARLREKRVDLLDGDAFIGGRLVPLPSPPLAERRELIAARWARMEKRQSQIAASSLLDHVADAEFGVVPLAVHRRATIALPYAGKADGSAR
jgi:dihydroxyacid dehydratase/phosphogluconate dehydratase